MNKAIDSFSALAQPLSYSPSSLYNIEPIGLGTPFVESLTSLLKRLAQMHHLSVRDLVAFCAEASPDRPIASEPHRLLWIDGVAASAGMWSSLLQDMTRNDRLQYTTMFHWQELLNPHGLLRPRQAWCPLCYDDWLKAGEPLYEPLLWRLQCVRVCLVHQCKLLEYCPTCEAGFNTITYKGVVGFCPKCCAWLGDEVRADEPVEPEAESNQIAQAVGQLLALAPRISLLKREIIPEVLEAIKQKRRLPNTRLSAALDSSINRLGELRLGVTAPTLALLARLEILSEGLLWKKLAGEEIALPPVPEASPIQVPKTVEEQRDYLDALLASSEPLLKPSDIAQRGGFADQWEMKTLFREHDRLIQQRRRDEQRQALQDVLDGEAIITVAALARQRRYHQSVLYKLFPELCHQVAEAYYVRREAKCRGILENLIESQIYPSIRAICKALEVADGYLWRHFPAEMAWIEAARVERSQQEKEAIKRHLDALLASKVFPSQSLEAIAQELGKSPQYLQRHFPEHAQCFLERRRDYHKEHLDEECARIRQEVLRLHQQGIYPSTDRVRAVVRNWMVHGTAYREAYIEAMKACGYSAESTCYARIRRISDTLRSLFQEE